MECIPGDDLSAILDGYPDIRHITPAQRRRIRELRRKGRSRPHGVFSSQENTKIGLVV
jgi:hypothetical protein